jgi:hypothetical protein
VAKRKTYSQQQTQASVEYPAQGTEFECSVPFVVSGQDGTTVCVSLLDDQGVMVPGTMQQVDVQGGYATGQIDVPQGTSGTHSIRVCTLTDTSVPCDQTPQGTLACTTQPVSVECTISDDDPKASRVGERARGGAMKGKARKAT